MTYDPTRHHRRSIRLCEYDYTQNGAYFVTVCIEGRVNMLGEVVNEEMHLNEFGQIVSDAWAWLATQYPYVLLDESVIMPNHLHGIIIIDNDHRGGSRTAPTPSTARKSLGRLIGAFKTVSAKQINLKRDTPGAPLWQRNYYEHIIRGAIDLEAIQRYIADNPAQWALDTENLNATSVPPRRSA